MMGAKVQNLDKLRRKLRRMPDVVKQATREAFVENANELVGMMNRLAPEISGTMKETISWEFANNSNSRIGVKGQEGLGIIVTAGADDENDPGFYASMVEFGTVDNPPHPFFFPAYRALRRRMKSRVSRKQSKALKQLSQS